MAGIEADLLRANTARLGLYAHLRSRVQKQAFGYVTHDIISNPPHRIFTCAFKETSLQPKRRFKQKLVRSQEIENEYSQTGS